MIQISFSKLTNQELFTLGFRTKEIIDPVITLEMGINPFYHKFSECFEPYQKGMQHTNISAEQLGIEDDGRDEFSIALRTHIKNYSHHPELGPQARKALEVIDKHGPNITRRGYETQTAINIQIINELDKDYSDFIKESNADVWLDLFKKAQNKFENTLKEHDSTKAEESTIESASSLRPALVNSLRKLYAFLPMQYELTGNNQLGKIIKELKVEVSRY